MSAELFIEVRCEELPARFIAGAQKSLADNVVKLLKEQKIPKDADWSGWGKWTAKNLLPILRQMASDCPRFREELMGIQQPVIGLCTKDTSLGTGMGELPTKKKRIRPVPF